MGYLDVTQRGGPFDGGVDVVAGRVDAWGHRSELAVQAKQYAAPVGRRYVDELLGAFRRQRYAEAGSSTCSPPTACSCKSANSASSSARNHPPDKLGSL